MPLETTNFIQGLDDSWPLGGDPTNKGDDHLRLIKHVLITQFPGVDGNGFKEAITATEQELNWLGGLTDNVQDQIDAINLRLDSLEGNLSAETGTRMVFPQAAPPTGWSLIEDYDDHMLHIVSTAGGTSGGTDSAILMDKVPLHTHTAATDTDPGHTHVCDRAQTHLADGTQGTWFSSQGAFAAGPSSDSMQLAGGHSHVVTVDNNTGGANWAPQYVDTIICEKD